MNDADRSPLPREVQPWTHVQFHLIYNRERLTAACSCGERFRSSRAAAATPSDVRAWQREHLQTAWPILIDKGNGETIHEFHLRLQRAIAEAGSRIAAAGAAAGLDRPVRPGPPYPVITGEVRLALDEEECLQQQLAILRNRHPNLLGLE